MIFSLAKIKEKPVYKSSCETGMLRNANIIHKGSKFGWLNGKWNDKRHPFFMREHKVSQKIINQDGKYKLCAPVIFIQKVIRERYTSII
jgi:hypothetical protein